VGLGSGFFGFDGMGGWAWARGSLLRSMEVRNIFAAICIFFSNGRQGQAGGVAARIGAAHKCKCKKWPGAAAAFFGGGGQLGRVGVAAGEQSVAYILASPHANVWRYTIIKANPWQKEGPTHKYTHHIYIYIYSFYFLGLILATFLFPLLLVQFCIFFLFDFYRHIADDDDENVAQIFALLCA